MRKSKVAGRGLLCISCDPKGTRAATSSTLMIQRPTKFCFGVQPITDDFMYGRGGRDNQYHGERQILQWVIVALSHICQVAVAALRLHRRGTITRRDSA